jgi:hypothetical protein
MLGVVEIYQRGQDDSPFDTDELATLVHLEPRPWLLAIMSCIADAELAFTTDTTRVSGSTIRCVTRRWAAGCRYACYCRWSRMRHRAEAECEQAARPDAHQPGAWCVDGTMACCSSRSSLGRAPEDPVTRDGVSHERENDWAKALLFPTAREGWEGGNVRGGAGCCRLQHAPAFHPPR